tara:strand:+ start:710 stop:895 length:186 start_codon:yes stop_codon:yes gene_type:complete
MQENILAPTMEGPARSIAVSFAVKIDDKIEQLRLQTKRVIHEDRQLLQANRRIMNSLYPKC